MTEQEIFEKLQQIISDVFKIEPESITMDSDLVGEFGADSLDATDIISRAEKEFDLSLWLKTNSLPDNFFAQPTIRAIVDIISAELKKSGNTIVKQTPKATNEITPAKNTHAPTKNTDIPNTEYITVNKDGIFVGGEPATHYLGQEIKNPEYVKIVFSCILEKLNPNVAEIHILSSTTKGKIHQPGNPSPEHGIYEWCRVKFNDGMVTDWVMYGGQYKSVELCARDCAHLCAWSFDAHPFFSEEMSIISKNPYKGYYMNDCLTKGISPDVLYPYKPQNKPQTQNPITQVIKIIKPQEPAVQPEQPETREALGIFGRVRRLLNKLNGAEKEMRK